MPGDIIISEERAKKIYICLSINCINSSHTLDTAVNHTHNFISCLGQSHRCQTNHIISHHSSLPVTAAIIISHLASVTTVNHIHKFPSFPTHSYQSHISHHAPVKPLITLTISNHAPVNHTHHFPSRPTHNC